MEKDSMGNTRGAVWTLEPGAICTSCRVRFGKCFWMNLTSNVVWEAAVSTMRLHGMPLMRHSAISSLLLGSLASLIGSMPVRNAVALSGREASSSAKESGSKDSIRRPAAASGKLCTESIPYR